MGSHRTNSVSKPVQDPVSWGITGAARGVVINFDLGKLLESSISMVVDGRVSD